MNRIALVAVGLLVALGITASFAQQGKQLSIVTGGTGGVYYPLGGGFASLIGKHIPGYTATAEVTGGSVANMQLVGAKKADIALTQVDAAWDAINGLDKFASGKLKIQALVVMYPNVMHVVTVEGTGINTIADLKGKRVSTGSPGSATEVFAFRIIEAAGLDKDKDMKRERLGASESVNALKDKKIDAFFFTGGLPTAAVTDLAATPNTKIKVIDHSDLVPKMVAKYGAIYSTGVITKDIYKGMDVDAQISTVWNILAVHEDMDDKLAYDLTKLMLEKRDDLGIVHAEGKNIKVELQSAKRAGIPFHKGALKYFADKGIKVE